MRLFSPESVSPSHRPNVGELRRKSTSTSRLLQMQPEPAYPGDTTTRRLALFRKIEDSLPSLNGRPANLVAVALCLNQATASSRVPCRTPGPPFPNSFGFNAGARGGYDAGGRGVISAKAKPEREIPLSRLSSRIREAMSSAKIMAGIPGVRCPSDASTLTGAAERRASSRSQREQP
jgi:hypothetical protein